MVHDGSRAPKDAAAKRGSAATPATGVTAEAASVVEPTVGTPSPEAQEATDPGQQSVADRHTEPQLLAAYGESTLSEHNIHVSGGTVTVRGGGIPPRHTVWVAGHEVPVDAKGNFIAEEVLPLGAHTVEVAVLDADGNGTLYLRDLEFKPNDRFYVGMADLTVAKNHTSDAAQLMQGANAPYDYNASVAGSLSFFATQKFANDWRVKAGGDTRREPVKKLFSNLLNKKPGSLFPPVHPGHSRPPLGCHTHHDGV